MSKKQKTLILASVGGVVAVALVVTLILVLVSHTSKSKHTASATPTPTFTPTPTITPTPLPNIWQSVSSINYGKGIAFSTSQPQIGYVCGNTNGILNSSNNLEIGKTSDSGFTWSAPMTTSVPGSNCRIAINPYNSDDIVMTSYQCWEMCGDDAGKPYRTLDGGKTWTKLVLPSGNEASYMTTPIDPVWTPDALFFTVTTPGAIGGDLPAPTHHIAVSVNGGPLAWTSQEPNFGLNMPASSVYDISIFTVGKTVNVYNANMSVPLQGNLSTSTDNGATWSSVATTGTIPNNLFPSSNEQTLYGITPSIKCVKSVDGGKTWTSLPDMQGDYSISISDIPLAMNDGSLFVFFAPTNNGTRGIYKLLPNATTWTLVTSTTTEQSFSAISSDKNGRPILIWSTSVHLSGNDFSPILEYHPA
jgi:hypothetical protein